MADVVKIVQSLPGLDQGLQPGTPTSIAGNIVSQVEGIARGSGLRGATSDFIQNGLASLGIGSGTDRNFNGVFDNFLSRVLQTYANVPSIMPLWVCYFTSLPSTAGQDASIYDVNSNGAKHAISDQTRSAVKSSDPNGSSGGALGMLFCQGVQTPEDSVGVSRDTYTGNIGGFLPGLISSSRSINQATLSFIDTNNSFVDFVLRPWMISNSYVGIPNSFKSNIIIEQYTKNGPGSDLRLRKKFTLVNAFPTNIDSEALKYADTNDYRQISFQFESYTLEGGSFGGVSRFVDKLIETGANIAEGLVTGGIDKFFSNVYTALRPGVAGLTSSNNVDIVNVPSQDTPDGQSVSNSSQIVKISTAGNAADLPAIPNQIKINRESDVPDAIDIVANRIQRVEVPGNDSIGLEELQALGKGPAFQPVLSNAADRIQQSAREALAPVFAVKKISTDDTPMYTPYGRSSPYKRPPDRDVKTETDKIPVAIKPPNKADDARQATITQQLRPINRQDVII